MDICHVFSYSDSCLYWCLAYIRGGTFWPTYIRRSDVSVPTGSGYYLRSWSIHTICHQIPVLEGVWEQRTSQSYQKLLWSLIWEVGWAFVFGASDMIFWADAILSRIDRPVRKDGWEGSIKSTIFCLSRPARTLKIILNVPLIRLIGLNSPIRLTPVIFGTKAI